MSWRAPQLFGDYLSLLAHYHGTSGFQICASPSQIWGPAYQLYIRIGCNKSTAAKLWQGDGCWQIKTIHIVVLFSKNKHMLLSDFFLLIKKLPLSTQSHLISQRTCTTPGSPVWTWAACKARFSSRPWIHFPLQSRKKTAALNLEQPRPKDH